MALCDFLGAREDDILRRDVLVKAGVAGLHAIDIVDDVLPARNLYEQGTLAQRDYEVYQRLYHAISAFLPPPDLVIYLQGSVDKLLAHINKRGREYERTIAPDYLARLNRLYNSWIDNWTTCPVVRVPMDRIDFLQNREDFEEIVQMVNDALTPHVAMS